jgi:hypothetical protein
MYRNKIPLEHCHLGVPWVHSKWFMSLWYVWHELCTYLAPTLTLSQNRPKRNSTWHMSSGSSIGFIQNYFWACGMIGAKSCTYLAPTLTLSPNRTKQDWHDPHHLGVQSDASKMISDPMEHSMQTVHLSCIKISTISKRTETRFHMDDVTYWFHRMRPKWFLSLWYVWHKPCSYLAPILTLSPNRPKQGFTSPTSYGIFGAKRAPILRQD